MKPIARLAVLAVVFGASLAAAQMPRVTGTITFRERMALPPTAVVDVRLEDVSRAEAVPPVVARTRIDRPGQVPIRFGVEYDAAAINPRGRYAVRASIMDGDTVLFASMDTALVLTQGHGQRVELVLTRVGTAKPRPAAVQAPPAPPLPPHPFADLPATFTGTLACADCEGIRYHLNLFGDDSFFLRLTYAGKPGVQADDLGSWALSSDRRVLVLKGQRDEHAFAIPNASTLRKLDADGKPVSGRQPQELKRSSFRAVDLRAPLRGAYSYMADAGHFVECSTGQRWPVAMEAGNRDLENAYGKVRPAPGAAVVVEVEGRITQRPKREGAGVQTTLVVEKAVRMLPKESCAPRFTSAPLDATYWRLTHLGERAVPAVTDSRREPSLTFQEETGQFAGSSGCNRLIGTYAVANATMTFTAGGTLMACKDEAQTEKAFLTALQATRTYRIAGHTLELFDAKGVRVARFAARMPSGITVR